MPGIVTDVSATLVETTTSRMPSGGGLKTCICFSLGRSAYSGTICIGTVSELVPAAHKGWRHEPTVSLFGLNAQLIIALPFVIRLQRLHIDVSVDVESKSLICSLRVAEVQVLSFHVGYRMAIRQCA